MGAILGGATEQAAPPPAEASDSFSQAYVEEAEAQPVACDPDALARELGLAPGLSARDLERLRRDFALANHPDRAAPADRDLATRRMALANVLIDQALQRSRRPSQ